MKATIEILDARFSGIAYGPHSPVVAPVRWHFPKWAFWKRTVKVGWAVVQPRRTYVDRDVYLLWRTIGIFNEKSDADEFLSQITPAEGGDA